MELKFEQKAVQYMQTIAGQMQTQEQTQQMRLADTAPDVKRIISAWGQVVIRGKQWLTGSVQISGGVMVWLLYDAENDAKAQCVETWLPFQMEWDIPQQERDGSITVFPFLRSIDARTLSDRKIMVRATISVLMQAAVPGEALYYEECELPDDVQVLRRTYPLLLPVEQGEKMINIDDALSTPVANCKIIRCSVLPNVSESRIVSDKLVMRGNLQLDMLLMDENGKIFKFQPELPFSQFAQLDAEYDPNAKAEISFVVTELETDKGESGELLLNCSFVAQFTIYDRRIINVIDDAYSTGRVMEMKKHQLAVPSLLDEKKQSIQIAGSTQQDGRQVLDVSLLMEDLQIKPIENVLHISPKGAFQVLSEDIEGKMVSSLVKCESVLEMENDSAAEVYVSSEAYGLPSIMGSNLSQQVSMNIKCISNSLIPMVSELSLGEESKLNLGCPSLILCVANDEDLWTLAKSTGSTMNAIMKANDLSSEPQPGQMLLIPIG